MTTLRQRRPVCPRGVLLHRSSFVIGRVAVVTHGEMQRGCSADGRAASHGTGWCLPESRRAQTTGDHPGPQRSSAVPWLRPAVPWFGGSRRVSG